MWWVKHIIVCVVSGFCLLFGIQLLIVAWKLRNPYEFFLCFIPSTMIISISAALFFGIIYRMLLGRRDEENKDEK